MISMRTMERCLGRRSAKALLLLRSYDGNPPERRNFLNPTCQQIGFLDLPTVSPIRRACARFWSLFQPVGATTVSRALWLVWPGYSCCLRIGGFAKPQFLLSPGLNRTKP